MTELQRALNTITDEIAFICEHMDSFIKQFCHKSTFDVYGISFDGINVKWNTVENIGMHACNEMTIAKYLRWKDKINDN